MGKITRKLKDQFKKIKSPKYTIFSGTNSWQEWFLMLKAWLISYLSTNMAFIDRYEAKFAMFCGVNHGISFGSGRMALYAILEALNIEKGDEIIIPAFTCIVVANAIIYRGAIPKYVDIRLEDFNIDVEKIEAAITPRTKALYAQHTFGVPCNIRKIREIAQRYHLPVIEDIAHALGATLESNYVGSLTEVAYCSTDHSKIINTYLGGIAITNNNETAFKLRQIQSRSTCLNKNDEKKLIRSFLIEYLLLAPRFIKLGYVFYRASKYFKILYSFHDELLILKPQNYPSQLSCKQAQLGISQLKKLEKNLTHRRQLASWLENKIKWYNLTESQVTESVWLRYSFLVKDQNKFKQIFGKQFELGIWFTSVLSGRSEDLHLVGYTLGSCPKAEFATQHIVNLPTHPKIPLHAIQKLIDENWFWLKDNIYYI